MLDHQSPYWSGLSLAEYGLTLIIQAHADAQDSGRRLHLRLGSPQVRRLFELTGVLDRLTFED